MPYPQTRKYRTWYGLTATVILTSKFWHKSGLGKMVIFHPAAVNWLLRKNLSEKNAITLSLRHEFCHLQTLPLAVFCGSVLVIFSADARPFLRWPVILIGSQAVWEMMAEFLTLAVRFESYQAIYAEVTSIPRIVFWLLAAMAAFLPYFF